ncbi:MAG: cyclic nucleotide-binding domain-containing protein [bacterium]
MRTLADREVLFEEGRSTHLLARVKTGTIRLLREGREIGRVGPGAWLGEASAFVENSEHFATALAVGEVTIEFLRHTELRSLRAAGDPDYLRLLTEALRTLADRIEAVNAEVVQRVRGGEAPPAGPGLLGRLWARVAEGGAGAPNPQPILQRLPGMRAADAPSSRRPAAPASCPPARPSPSRATPAPPSSSCSPAPCASCAAAPTAPSASWPSPAAAPCSAPTPPCAAPPQRHPRGRRGRLGPRAPLADLDSPAHIALAECLAGALGAQLAAADAVLMATRGTSLTLPDETARAALGHVEAWQALP